MVDAAQRRGIQVDVAALERELGVPVVETVAVRKQGAKALVERLDAMVPHLDAPVPGPEGGIDYHAKVRQILSVAVRMPARTAKIDDALDRWLLHPVFGLVSLAVVMPASPGSAPSSAACCRKGRWPAC
ncbi:hypothetical protein G6F68_013228 [Rhizopus microsporus]|nr:hypothetical protein G6F68_013228 [Rhizopus microsporus]